MISERPPIQQAGKRSVPQTTTFAALKRHGAWTLGLNLATLFVTLITGVLIARVLGTAGRGQVTSAMMPAQLIGWAFAMGCGQAVSYRQARHPEDAPRLIGAWLTMLVPIGLVAVIVGEILIRYTLASQPATLRAAQVYMAVVITILLADLVYGILLGDHDFLFCNLMRLGQPLLTALSYVILWRTGLFNVGSAVATALAAAVVCLALAFWRVGKRHGIGRPAWQTAKQTLWYGVRAHGANVSDMVNLRLDLVIIPAFLATSTVGIYAVAATAAGLIVSAASGLSLLILPIVARSGDGDNVAVAGVARLTFMLGLAMSIGLAVICPAAVRFVYGESFASSVGIIWILLPGAVLYATASVIRPGLYAANRPLSAALSYSIGMPITVLGLFLSLPRGGIVGAAIISTASYAAVWALTTTIYARTVDVPFRRFIPGPADVRWAQRRLVSRGRP